MTTSRRSALCRIVSRDRSGEITLQLLRGAEYTLAAEVPGRVKRRITKLTATVPVTKPCQPNSKPSKQCRVSRARAICFMRSIKTSQSSSLHHPDSPLHGTTASAQTCCNFPILKATVYRHLKAWLAGSLPSRSHASYVGPSMPRHLLQCNALRRACVLYLPRRNNRVACYLD